MIAAAMLALVAAASPAAEPLPNVVLVFADDLGYADLGCTGAKGVRTPHLDRLAAEGVRLTNFHVAQAVCSASRAALLTGCYPNRIGILGALGPKDAHGLNEGERTLGDVFRSRGYATAAYGKWHLGHKPSALPTHHGFDDYFGLPYSNDMWPKHPTNRTFPDLPLIDRETVVELNPDQSQLTKRYTERAVRFVAANKDKPFFLYLAHSMPHVPLAASDAFRGKSAHGLYGDVIEELDWSVGQVLAAIEERGLDNRTLVLFASDNGPWLPYGDHAGSAGPLREGKGTTFEGGMRVPFVARWPGRLPAGRVSDAMAMTIDVLPTLAALIGATPPPLPIDGKDVWPLLAGTPNARSPHEGYPFYWGRELQAVSDGRWKLHFPHKYRTLTGKPGSGGRPGGEGTASIGLALFDLATDIGETKDVSADHPDVVARLKALAERARDDLGDSATGKTGKGVRPARGG